MNRSKTDVFDTVSQVIEKNGSGLDIFYVDSIDLVIRFNKGSNALFHLGIAPLASQHVDQKEFIFLKGPAGGNGIVIMTRSF